MSRHEPRPRVQLGLQRTLMVFHVLLLVSGIVLLCLALWLMYDPAREFLLRLVHFSESTPYLEFAIYLMLGTSLLIFIAVGVGFSGLWKLERCLLSGLISLLMLLVHFKVVILGFLVFFHFKFSDETAMTNYLSNIAHNRYYRDKWAAPLMDSIQYYHKCCGGNGARDYEQSFWYMTNTERGTSSFVPYSCCRQTQNARAWHLQPIDPLCIQYTYGTRAFNDSINWTGCGGPTFRQLNWLLHLLAIVLIVLIVLDALGLFLVFKCLLQVWKIYSLISSRST